MTTSSRHPRPKTGTGARLFPALARRPHAPSALRHPGAIPDSRDRLRGAVDTLLDPLVVLRAVRDGRGAVVDLEYIYANRAALAAHARLAATAPHTRIAGFVPATLAAALVSAGRQVLETGQPLTLDDVALPPGAAAADRHFDVRLAPIGGAELSVTWRDVTARHAAAQQLRESEQRFRLLAENASDVVYRARPGQGADWVSPNVERTLGWAVEDLLGTQPFDLIHPEDRAELARHRDRMLAGEPVAAPPSGYPCRVRGKDGPYRWMMLRPTAIWDRRRPRLHARRRPPWHGPRHHARARREHRGAPDDRQCPRRRHDRDPRVAAERACGHPPRLE